MSRSIETLYESCFGKPAASVVTLPAHGSNRKLYRASDGERTVIGVESEDQAENQAFLAFSRHFRKEGLPVPEIYGVGEDETVYLEEDLGDETLFDLLSRDRGVDGEIGKEAKSVYEKAVRQLSLFQVSAGKSLDYSLCYPRHSFDRQSMMWDLNYFKYYFLKLANIPFNEQRLEDDFDVLTGFLLEAEDDFFLYRDFQSRNIMVRDGEPWFIDYQGGRRGALQYDVASLLYDSKANLSDDFRTHLLDVYLDSMPEGTSSDREKFLKYFQGFILIRLIQAMGAYGFRGFYERKAHFLQSVPYAIRNLENLLSSMQLPVEIPALTEALQLIVRSTKLREIASVALPLKVEMMSFSYKKGLPHDDSGHGGGFIFDCRALPNPGREEEFRSQTGHDSEVIRWLESKEEVHSFLAHIRGILHQVVETYGKRNFSHLSVAFGCTGGQHRSVFCANQLARYLKEKLGISVELSHREFPET